MCFLHFEAPMITNQHDGEAATAGQSRRNVLMTTARLVDSP
jgi:hypothetical protein